jgi:YidC/Oxa1 family membrane protein insertase
MVFAFAAWMGWQSYLTKKYPDAYKKNVVSQKTDETTAAPGTIGADQNTAGVEKSGDVQSGITSAPQVKNPEMLKNFEDETWSFQVSSRGMGLKNVFLKKYSDRAHMPISFSTDEGASLFSTYLTGYKNPVDFVIKQNSENLFVGEATVNGMKIIKTIEVSSLNYSFKTSIAIDNITPEFNGLITQLADKTNAKTGSMFSNQRFDSHEFYVEHEGKDSRVAIKNEAHLETFSQAHVAGLSSQYFTAAMLDNSQIIPDFKAKVTGTEASFAEGQFIYPVLNKDDKNYNLKYLAYVGPKSIEILKTVDSSLTPLVNLGFFTFFAKKILWLMNTIHKAVGNWGLTIILLTILVRMIVLPFNVVGYKQMKAMAKIQPQIKVLREKYKTDQQQLNKEMMSLMKDAKANPLGGCLPMLVQIPVFFALYQVIGQSIELYQAPFIFWITDLSIKDPFYVLPVLMGITMYFQQKISPSTLEPAQQKIMAFLPIFFTFLMVSLPSGLTLYIFISSIFGVLQQLYFMKDKESNTATQKLMVKT